MKKDIDKLPILKVLLVQSFHNISGSIFRSPVLPLFVRSLGASMAQIGAMSMFSYLGYAFFEPTLGLLSDRISRKKIVMVALIIDTLVILSYTFFPDIRWIYFVDFIHAACSAGFTAPTRALIADITPKEKRGKNYGAFLTLQALGRMPGPYIGGYLAYNFNYILPFYVGATVNAISSILTLLYYPSRASPREDSVELRKPSSRSIFNTRTIIFIATRALPMFFGFYGSILTIMLKESPLFNATEVVLGLMATSISIVNMGTQYLAGLILDRIGSAKLIIFGFALDGVAYFGYLIANNLAYMWLVRLVMASISPFYTIGMMVIMMELVSRENYGFAMGLYGLSEDLGGIVGSLVLGAMYDQYGFATCTYFMSFVCLVAVFMVWVNMHNHKKRLLQQP